MTPLPIVFATATPNTKAATKFQNAAQATACTGRSTRVATTVAIEFAASWNPLLKSKTSARRMVRMRRTSMGSGVLQQDPFDDVRHVLALVYGHLHALVDLLPLQDADRVGAGRVEELAQGAAVDGVAPV